MKTKRHRPKTSASAAELLNALQSGQFAAWFQPQKSLKTDRIVSAEALLRWIKPDGEVLKPSQFIEQVANAGLDEALLYSMCKQAISAQHLWHQELGVLIPISINLPTHLLDDAQLPDRLNQWVIACHGDPLKLSFELTETSTALNQVNYYSGTFRLRMMGFGLAQDDFGKGYSSLHQLLSTTFSTLKIDRSLLQGCDSNNAKTQALNSVIQLGHQLGLTVVVEGVETSAQLALLQRLGCDQVQGFLVGEALPEREFIQAFTASALSARPAIKQKD